MLRLCFSLLCLGLALRLPAAAASNIRLDQVGYLTWTSKVAVLARPMVGQGSPSTFDPGTNFEIRRVADDSTAHSGTVSSFGGGATHTQSGDRGWWADFSALSSPGDYYLYLPAGSSPGAVSHPFRIGNDVYNSALDASSKSYYYQRCGTAVTATHGGAWTHAACHLSTQNAALLYNGGVVGGTARDVTGGWHDAGDYRKYVSFAAHPLWDLLTSYEWNPCVYGDATNIPESGNGVPDILDEVKWELDWLLKMQIASGGNAGALYSGAFVTGGAGGNGDPSTETATYYYANYSSAATAVGAFAFAQGARVLGAFPAYSGYAATLQAASEAAWAWLQANPANVTYNHAGFTNADANRSAEEDAGLRLLAAVELWRLTGNAAYKAYFDTHYLDNIGECGHHPLNNTNYGYRNSFDASCNGSLQRAYVSYCLGPSPTGSIVTQIRTAAANGAANPHNGEASDLYRAYMWDGHYTWGSNQAKAAWSHLLLWAVKIDANPALRAAWADSASEYVHYFFGRNPLGWSYTTQSQGVGAEQSITKIYHSWFHEGTAYDSNPAPGILAGGPNQFYANDVASAGGTAVYPPAGEPIQKSYKDWNKVWPDASWTVTENGIYYQARYQFLLAAHAACSGPLPTPTATPTFTVYAGTPTSTWTATPSPSATVTATPVCQTLLNGAETLGENGSWSGPWATRAIVASGGAPGGAVTQGSNALHVNITVTAGWNGDFANLAGFSPAVWTPYTQLAMDVHVDAGLVAGATYAEMLLRADCASCGAGLWYQPISADTPGLIAGPQTLTWALDLSQGTLPLGAAISKLTLVFNNDASNPVGSLYIDNVRLIGACAAPSATASPSRTPTASRSATPTATMTATPSPTRSASPTLTATAMASATPSVTESPSVVAGSPTETALPASPTSTQTAVPTATFAGTETPTTTATGSGTMTRTASRSRTITPTATPFCDPYVTRIGYSGTFSPSFSSVTNTVFASAWTLFQPITVNRMSLDTGSATYITRVRLAIYADAGGVPGALIVEQTQLGSYCNNCRHYVRIPETTLLPGVYWLAGQAHSAIDGYSATIGSTVQSGAGVSAGWSWGAFPGAFPAASTTNVRYSIAASFACETPTVTPTVGSRTPTPSATPEATPTISPSATDTPILSPTFSVTASPVLTATPSFTAQATAANTGTLEILAAKPWPNPDPKALRFQLSGPADSMRMRVYTTAWILVKEIEAGPWNAGWNRMDFGTPGLSAQAAGLYYVELVAKRDRVVSQAATTRLVLLRR